MKTMKEYETMKVYGKIINRWMHENERGHKITDQVEVEYKEYDSNGNLIGIGTEDFSGTRWHDQTNLYFIWGWDGSHYNKGRHRYFERLGECHINRKDVYKLKQLAMIWNKNRNLALVDVRA